MKVSGAARVSFFVRPHSRMWTCEKCQCEVEDNYFACWKCSTPKPGVGDGIEWFETEDPAVLVIPQSFLSSWLGAEPFAPGVPSQDWERAAAVSGWLGAIRVGSGQALVLNDLPTNAGFSERDGTLSILRWLCADSANDLLALVESGACPSEAAAPVSFVHPGGALCLIGAGDHGPELGYQPPVTELATGRYSVTSSILKKPRTEVLIHRFEHAV